MLLQKWLKQLLSQRLFQETQQSIPEGNETTEDLENSIKTGRIPLAQGDFAGLKSH